MNFPGHPLLRISFKQCVKLSVLAPIIPVFFVFLVISVIFLVVTIFLVPVLSVVFFHDITSYIFNIGKVS